MPVFHDSFFAMGTRLDLVIPETHPEEGRRCADEIRSEVNRLERKLSRFDSASSLSTLNSEAGVFKQLAVLVQTGAVASAMPWWKPVAAGLPTQAPSDRVRLGIVGPGSRGKYLMRQLQELDGIEIAAFCDDYPPHFDWAQDQLADVPRVFLWADD